MILPTLKFEQALWKKGILFAAGVDEVGRGALAGPVVAAAVMIDKQHKLIPGVRDSKTLSQKRKLELSTLLQRTTTWAVGEASSQEIDDIGIVPATALAMKRAIEKIGSVSHVLIDGLPFKNQELLTEFAKTFIVKGDALSYSIAAASILAKVYRDTIMKQLGLDFPEYHFDKNVGYGTADHLKSITQVGLSTHHRKLFCRNFISK